MLADQQGIYVSVMLFDVYCVQFDRHPDDGYPFDEANNINGIAAPGTTAQDLSGPAVTAVQDAYMRKVIDTNDLENVLYRWPMRQSHTRQNGKITLLISSNGMRPRCRSSILWHDVPT